MTDNPYQAPSASTTNDMVKCIGCSRMLHITASTCPECGANQRKRAYKSKTTAAVLAFFLGGLGVHRFYLGQWWGIFYLLFFIFWIPGLIAFIEMIVFLCTSQEKWDHKYNEGRPRGPADSGGAGVIVLLIVGVFMFIAFIGILAAIALPAYQDYTTRAKVAEPLSVASSVKADITNFYEQNGSLPTSNMMINIDEPLEVNDFSQLEIAPDGAIVITFNGAPIEGETLIIRPEPTASGLQWSCDEGTLAAKYRPSACR